MKPDNFTNIPLTGDNISMYVMRTCIWNAVKKCAPNFHGKLLDVGCGRKPYRQYLLDNNFITSYDGLDITTAIIYDDNVQPDHTWDGITMPFGDNSFDTIMATELLEHCPDTHLIINEMKRVLKPGGMIFFTVPFLWNLHEVPNDQYRFTPFALQRIFEDCGLEKIELFAHGGWNMSLAQMIGMWVVATKRGKKRKRWAFILNPIVKKLMKKDLSQHPVPFTDGMMVNGLYGMGRKKTAPPF